MISVWQAGFADIASHFAIRHQVFVEEQGVIVFTDVDAIDQHDDVIHVVAASDSQIAGTVRLYPTDSEGQWKGDRLAVLPKYRASQVGAHLVRFAVRRASERGGREMAASVQVPNTRFFEFLGWRKAGDVGPYYGLPHQPMAIDLQSDRAKATTAKRGHARPTELELQLPVHLADRSPILVAS